MIFVINQDWQNKKHLQEKNVYKIMCLGDSMTLNGGEDSYPSQLEKILNGPSQVALSNSKLVFKVINKAIGGAKSQKIVDNVEGFLAQYHPDMVVVMMGIMQNQDSYMREAKYGLLSNFDRSLNNLKTYRLLKNVCAKCITPFVTLTEHWSILRSKEPDVPPQTTLGRPVSKDNVIMLMYAIHFRTNKDYLKAEVLLRYLLTLDLDNEFLERVKSELVYMYYDQERYRDMVPLIDHFLNLCGVHNYVALPLGMPIFPSGAKIEGHIINPITTSLRMPLGLYHYTNVLMF